MVTSRKGKIEIDLSGPRGNAFALVGMATNWLKQMGKDDKPVIDDMMSGDYEHLLEVMEREFGSFLILNR